MDAKRNVMPETTSGGSEVDHRRLKRRGLRSEGERRK